MIHLRFLPAFLIASGLCCGAFADTVTLKTGEVIEGKISSESDTQLTLELKLPGGITDSLTVSKDDVLSIAKVQPDELAWAPLMALKPGTTSLPAAFYETATQSLKGFLAQFATSPFAADAQKALAALE